MDDKWMDTVKQEIDFDPESHAGHPLESPCKGVIISVGRTSDNAILVYWPHREGYATPYDIGLMDGDSLLNNCFGNWPDGPGVFQCTVTMSYDPGSGCDSEPEWTFHISDEEPLFEMPVSTK